MSLLFPIIFPIIFPIMSHGTIIFPIIFPIMTHYFSLFFLLLFTSGIVNHCIGTGYLVRTCSYVVHVRCRLFSLTYDVVYDVYTDVVRLTYDVVRLRTM